MKKIAESLAAAPFFDVAGGFARTGIAHGFFSRHGGISPHPFASLNVGLATGDGAENVCANRERIRLALGFKTLAAARQVHGDQVRVVREAPADVRDYDGVDALVSDLPGVGLMIQQADCQAVLLADPVRRAVGICHSGWRGSVAGIIGKTVRAMALAFGSRPEDLAAAVSPSLGPCCAEFINFRDELPSSFHPFGNSLKRFDFWAISAMQLRDSGILPENIHIDGRCTVCDERFFSYRREKTTGRCASVIGVCGG